jgi:hypothetical protein
LLVTTTHDDNATTWRDLVRDLTADEVTNIEGVEREIGADPRGPSILLNVARDYVLHRTVDTAYSDVPLPNGAQDVSGWEQNLKCDGWSRSIEWRKFGDSDMSVMIDGRQQCDGSYTCEISVYGPEDDITLTGAGARRLMTLLADAADELDRLQK